MLPPKHWLMILGAGILASVVYNVVTKEDKAPLQMSGVTNAKIIWKVFKPQNERFEVLLPSIPQHVSEAHPAGNEFTKYDVYLSQDREGNVYMISFTQYPESYQMGSPEDVLEAVKNGALGSNKKNELKTVESSTYFNMPALDFSIQNSDSAIRSKAIVNDKTLIVLTVMNRDPTKVDDDFNTFAGSFVLNPKQGDTQTSSG